MNDVTEILLQIKNGDRAATEQLLPLVYAELREAVRRRTVRSALPDLVCSSQAKQRIGERNRRAGAIARALGSNCGSVGVTVFCSLSVPTSTCEFVRAMRCSKLVVLPSLLAWVRARLNRDG